LFVQFTADILMSRLKVTICFAKRIED